MKKRIIFLILLVVFVFATNITNVEASGEIYYKTVSTAISSQIEVSQEILKKAKSNATKKGNAFTYVATISDEYEMHIYHFECPSQGYYAFYTTGSTDTVIKIYEHQNFLFWTTKFEDRAYNDDGCLMSSYSNASLTYELTKNEDYYICVRAYGTRTGQYTLHVEPNQDKISMDYCSYSNWDGEKYCNARALSQYYTLSKQYLTKEQVVVFYWCLLSEKEEKVGKITKLHGADDVMYDFDGLYNAYKESVADGISYVNTMLGILCSIPKVPNYVGFSATVLGTMIDIIYKESTTTSDEMLQILHNKCGAFGNGDAYFYYDGAKIIEYSSYTANSGLCVTDYMYTVTNENGYSFTNFYKGYTEYNDVVRVGSEYDKGKWTK